MKEIGSDNPETFSCKQNSLQAKARAKRNHKDDSLANKAETSNYVWKLKTNAQPAPDLVERIKSAGTLCRAAETVCDCRAKTLEVCKWPVENQDMLVQSIRFL